MQRINVIFPNMDAKTFLTHLQKAEQYVKAKLETDNNFLSESQVKLFNEVVEKYRKEAQREVKAAPKKIPRTRSLEAHLDMDGCLTHQNQFEDSRMMRLNYLEQFFDYPPNSENQDETNAYWFLTHLFKLAKAQQILDDNDGLWEGLAKEAKEGHFSHLTCTTATNRQDNMMDQGNSHAGRGSYAPVFRLMPFKLRDKLDEIGAYDIAEQDDPDILANVYSGQTSSAGPTLILEGQQFNATGTHDFKEHASYICDDTKFLMMWYKLHRGDKAFPETQDEKSLDRAIFIDDKRPMLKGLIDLWEKFKDFRPRKEFHIRSWPTYETHPNLIDSEYSYLFEGEINAVLSVGTGTTDKHYKEDMILLTAILLGRFKEAEFRAKVKETSFEDAIVALRSDIYRFAGGQPLSSYHYRDIDAKLKLFRNNCFDALSPTKAQSPAEQPKAATSTAEVKSDAALGIAQAKDQGTTVLPLKDQGATAAVPANNQAIAAQGQNTTAESKGDKTETGVVKDVAAVFADGGTPPGMFNGGITPPTPMPLLDQTVTHSSVKRLGQQGSTA